MKKIINALLTVAAFMGALLILSAAGASDHDVAFSSVACVITIGAALIAPAAIVGAVKSR